MPTYPLAVITPAYLAVITTFNTEQEGVNHGLPTMDLPLMWYEIWTA
jgi:hypothetical protein